MDRNDLGAVLSFPGQTTKEKERDVARLDEVSISRDLQRGDGYPHDAATFPPNVMLARAVQRLCAELTATETVAVRQKGTICPWETGPSVGRVWSLWVGFGGSNSEVGSTVFLPNRLRAFICQNPGCCLNSFVRLQWILQFGISEWVGMGSNEWQ